MVGFVRSDECGHSGILSGGNKLGDHLHNHHLLPEHGHQHHLDQIGNCLVVTAVLTSSKLRTPGNTFLVNLAVSGWLGTWIMATMVMRLVTYADIVAILAIWGFVDFLVSLILSWDLSTLMMIKYDNIDKL